MSLGGAVMVGRDPERISAQPNVETRRVLRCSFCNLNQFATVSGNCRRCHQPYFAPQPEIEKTSIRFGAMVRVFRKARGFSQSDLGRRFGCNRSYITKVETGLNLPTAETLVKLARALNLPAAILAHCYDIARH